MTYDHRAASFALSALFFLPGFGLASWVTRTPAIRDGLEASLSEMGFVLFGLSVGSMTGILSSGWFVGRIGTRRVTLIGQSLICFSTVVIAAGAAFGSPLLVAFGLALFGGGVGFAEISMNVDGGTLERDSGKPILHALHGFFSLGTVVGALVGMAMTAIALPVAWHLALVSVVAIAILGFAIGQLPEQLSISAGSEGSGSAVARRRPLYRDMRLILIGLVVLAMAMAEGAANDWLPILMVDEHGFSETSGSLIYLTFAAAMTVGRFVGGGLIERLGRATLIRGCAVLGAIGLAIIITTQSPVLAWLAVVLWGLGASLGFPVAISAAGDSGEDTAARVKFVAMGGYIAFLVGPPFLGMLGEEVGLRGAMGVIFFLLLIAAMAASATGRKAAPVLTAG